jgi:hypothetical protein
MTILFKDAMQTSNLPGILKTGALSEKYIFKNDENGFVVDFPLPVYIDCMGIGYTDGSFFKAAFAGFDGWMLDGATALTNTSEYLYRMDGGGAYESDYAYLLGGEREAWHSGFEQVVYFRENGLYKLERPVITKRVTITTNASYIGRLGMGRGVTLGTALAKEPAFNSSVKTRLTLSGQTLPGIGGYSYRSVVLDTRYKIGEAEMYEIKHAYKDQIGPGLPFFISFEEEARRLPFIRMYAIDKKNDSVSFESGVNRFLFSRKFDFEECF